MSSTHEVQTPTRRGRGRPARISQQQIVDAAIELGLDSFTMQGIAERLAVGAPALYSHVAGRDEVLALVNDELRERLASFSSGTDDWRRWLRGFAGSVRTHLAPSAASLMVDLRMASTANGTVMPGVGEVGLQLLIDEGLSPAEAGYAMWLVFRVAITAGAEHQASFAPFVAEAGETLAATALPATQAVQDALADGTPHDTFTFDLDVVLDGIAARIRRQRRRSPRRT